jgi:hypothetical protein
MLKHVNYVYIEDGMGELVASVQKSMPVDENSVFIKIIAMRKGPHEQWNKKNKDLDMAIQLKGCRVFRLYENYEKFFEEFMDAIF